MIKAVLFDYAGVVTSGIPSKELSERISENLNVDKDAARKLLMLGWKDFSRGKISEEVFWNRIEEGLGEKIPDNKKDIWETYSEHMRPLPEIVEMIDWLRSQNIKTGLLSNVIPPTAKDIKVNGGYKHFDFLVLSCEVGHAKPDIEIYKIALDNLTNIKSEEVLFIDDREVNLLPANELDMRTIHAKNLERYIGEIYDLVK